MGEIRHAIAVASGKGGVGKSTVSMNLAVALAQAGARVGLLDADVYGPSVPIMAGLGGQHPRSPDRQRVLPLVNYGVKFMSFGFLVPEQEALAFRGPVAHQIIQEFLHDVDWGDLDYLVVDLPPGTGDPVISLVQSLPLSGALIVTTPQNLAVVSVVRCVALFRERNAPLLGIIENMTGSPCPHCGERLDIFGHGKKVRDLAASWGIPLLGAIPLDPGVRESGDLGEPVVLRAPASSAAQTLIRLAQVVAAGLDPSRAEPSAPIPGFTEPVLSPSFPGMGSRAPHPP